jgi:hypothetical protein
LSQSEEDDVSTSTGDSYTETLSGNADDDDSSDDGHDDGDSFDDEEEITDGESLRWDVMILNDHECQKKARRMATILQMCGLRTTRMAHDVIPGQVERDAMLNNMRRSRAVLVLLQTAGSLKGNLSYCLLHAAQDINLPVFVLKATETCAVPHRLKPRPCMVCPSALWRLWSKPQTVAPHPGVEVNELELESQSTTKSSSFEPGSLQNYHVEGGRIKKEEEEEGKAACDSREDLDTATHSEKCRTSSNTASAAVNTRGGTYDDTHYRQEYKEVSDPRKETTRSDQDVASLPPPVGVSVASSMHPCLVPDASFLAQALSQCQDLSNEDDSNALETSPTSKNDQVKDGKDNEQLRLSTREYRDTENENQSLSCDEDGVEALCGLFSFLTKVSPDF